MHPQLFLLLVKPIRLVCTQAVHSVSGYGPIGTSKALVRKQQGLASLTLIT